MCAARDSASNGFWLARNLATGALQFDTTSNNIPSSSATGLNNVYIGNSDTGVDGFNGYIAAAMCNYLVQTPLSLADGIMWSTDPWSFWYPNTFGNFYWSDFNFGTAAAIVARAHSLPLMGAGQ
jgi:hypothetical protein